MIIAIDFDGTIVEHRFPAIGKPLPFAFDALKALQADGHQLVLWTNREDKYLNEAIEFCRTNGVEFYAVNSEYPGASWTGSGVSRKLNADIYIDDKNLGGLLPWDEIYEKITELAAGKKAVHKKKHKHHKQKKFWGKSFFESIA